MVVLLDTHIVIWLSTEPDRVPKRLQRLVAEADRRYISVVSYFEIALKHRKDPEGFPFTFEFLEYARNDLQALELPLRKKHIAHVEGIPSIHREPFDHLLMSQAIEEQLVLVTMDTAFASYAIDGLVIRS